MKHVSYAEREMLKAMQTNEGVIRVTSSGNPDVKRSLEAKGLIWRVFQNVGLTELGRELIATEKK